MKVLNKFLKNGTGNYVEGVVNGRTGSGPVRLTSCETPHDTFNNDLRHWKLSRADPANRMEWRKKLRTNIGAVRPTLSGTDTLNE